MSLVRDIAPLASHFERCATFCAAFWLLWTDARAPTAERAAAEAVPYVLLIDEPCLPTVERGTTCLSMPPHRAKVLR
eukprot:2308282-Prymnesium_polylepis.1